MALEEAFLADQGFTEKLVAKKSTAAGNNGYNDSILKGLKEVTGSNKYARCHFLNQVSQL